MTRHSLLQISPITPPADARLDADYDVAKLWLESDPQAFLAEHGKQFDVAAIHMRFPFPASLMQALPNLRAIASFGVGYDRLDLEAARERGIQVSNTPNVLNDCVADIAMGLVIDVARGLSATSRFVRAGSWKAGQQRPLMTRVHGKRLGLLGYGGIGRAVARRAGGFDMQVRYHARHEVAGAPHEYMDSLVALAAWADFLVVACVGGPQTFHLVSAEVLDALGPEGFLVNIARGSVVDEQALVAALGEGRLGGAGLDVFENEPDVPEALLQMDNVVALSHIAGFSRESRADMEALVCDNVDAYVRTGKLLTPL